MKPTYILIHCTDVPTWKISNQLWHVDNYHKTQDYPLSRLGYYVGYHALVTGGKIYETRLDTEVGAHCNTIVDGKSMNVQSLGICWGGDGDVEYPSTQDMALLRDKIKQWQMFYKIPDSNVKFHRDYNRMKTCPGSLLGKEWLDNLLVPKPKPEDQTEKQIEIVKQKITLIQKIIDLMRKLNLA